MEFLNYKDIKAKLKKKSLIFKKPSLEDASSQFYALAKQLDDQKLYSGHLHLAVAGCQAQKSGQLGAFLNAARAFSHADCETTSLDDHIKAVIWIYTEALLICDRSFIRPICLEMGRFYESNKMYQQAAECFKQSMSISKCVQNLIMSEKYETALDELKNCPSHLMRTKDHISMFLLELLLHEDANELNRNSLQHLILNSTATTSLGPIPIDDQLFDLSGLLETLLIIQQDKMSSSEEISPTKVKVKETVVGELSAFLDPAQIQLLHLIVANKS